MPGSQEHVAQFRDIVDRTIIQTNGRNPGIYWLGKDTEASMLGLDFTSVDRSYSRLSQFGSGEGHLWGIAKRNQSVGRFAGAIAIVSLEENNEALYRRWGIHSPLGAGLGISSQRELNQEETELAVRWAFSPHLYADILKGLGRLVAEEENHIGRSFDIDRVSGRQLAEDLERMDRARRSAYNHIDDTLIN